jgi:hypothetical protein
MKLYVLTGGFAPKGKVIPNVYSCEGEIVLGVYSSEAEADLQKGVYIDREVKSYKFDYYTIREMSLDAEPDDDYF